MSRVAIGEGGVIKIVHLVHMNKTHHGEYFLLLFPHRRNSTDGTCVLFTSQAITRVAGTTRTGTDTEGRWVEGRTAGHAAGPKEVVREGRREVAAVGVIWCR